MTVRQTRNIITPSLGRIERRFKTLPRLAFRHWRRITPKDTGNARKRTRLRGNTIQARYPYAKRLDEGWSRQAPKGMFKPTFDFIKKHSRRMLRKR